MFEYFYILIETLRFDYYNIKISFIKEQINKMDKENIQIQFVKVQLKYPTSQEIIRQKIPPSKQIIEVEHQNKHSTYTQLNIEKKPQIKYENERQLLILQSLNQNLILIKLEFQQRNQYPIIILPVTQHGQQLQPLKQINQIPDEYFRICSTRQLREKHEQIRLKLSKLSYKTLRDPQRCCNCYLWGMQRFENNKCLLLICVFVFILTLGIGVIAFESCVNGWIYSQNIDSLSKTNLFALKELYETNLKQIQKSMK